MAARWDAPTPDDLVPTTADLSPRPFAAFDSLARSLVALDVELGEEPRHRLAGFRGEEPLAVIDLRPFPPGGIHAPLVEALAGLLALGADRLGAALPGRAWSMDDPVAPVTEAGDLRQRVLMCSTAEPGRAVRTWLRPFDLRDGELSWQEPVLEDSGCEGWVPHALQVAVDADWEPDPEAAADQLARCGSLGHHVMLAPAGAALIGAVTPQGGNA